MKRLFAILAVVMVPVALTAQDKGYLTGSFETTDHLYVADEPNNFAPSTDPFGSNNYLKLDYYNGNVSAGMQLEMYAPGILGYPKELDGFALSNFYVNWKDEDFQVTAGTFYDQFGSGLLFRSWEDRLLGMNNALLGARFAYNWEDKLAVKAIWGTPRIGMNYMTTQEYRPIGQQVTYLTPMEATRVRGLDLSLSLSNLIGLDDVALNVEGSLLSRYEKISPIEEEAGAKHNTTGYSGRLNFEWNGFFFKGEYVDTGVKLIKSELPKKGNAQLVELGYNNRGLGVTVTGRRLEWMGQKIISKESNELWKSSANQLSYVPAMCTQYTYMLTTLHPYNPQVGDATTCEYNSGEMGGQIDAFYNFRRGTALGGKRGMKVHANFATYFALSGEGSFAPGNLLFRDLSIDIQKQWTKKFKTILLYSMQEYNPTYGQFKSTHLSNIIVADLLYKWTSRFSTRMELQYLTTHEGTRDWMAALLEVSFAPHWSVWASDMYNHGNSLRKMHYYNVGVSYTKGRTRVAAGYGRYKDGYICSGGVCRIIPQYTGANLTVTTSF